MKVELTTGGEILVQLAITEADALAVAGYLSRIDAPSANRTRAVIAAQVSLARHHALTGATKYGTLTSGQRQGYIENGLIEPVLEHDGYGA